MGNGRWEDLEHDEEQVASVRYRLRAILDNVRNSQGHRTGYGTLGVRY